MKKRITLLCLTALILLGGYFAANKTYSWLFQKGGAEGGGTFSQVSYLPSLSQDAAANAAYGRFLPATEENEDGTLSYLYLGRELLTADGGLVTGDRKPDPLRLENRSKTETSVRVRISGQVRRVDADGSVTMSRPLTGRHLGGSWYLGVQGNGGAAVPLIRITFGSPSDGSYRWNYAGTGPAPSVSEGALGEYTGQAEQWDLELADGTGGGYTTVIPAASEGLPMLFDVLSSVRGVDDMTLGGTDEDSFFALYSKTDVTLCVEYYARQAEAMAWDDWPATYRMEVKL